MSSLGDNKGTCTFDHRPAGACEAICWEGGRTKGGTNTKLHAVCGSQGRLLNLFVTAGPVSDDIGARALVNSLPDVDWLLGDRGYDADWFREALKDMGIRACIPGRKQRKKSVNTPLSTMLRNVMPDKEQAPLQAAQLDRNHIQRAQGLAMFGNTI